MPAAEAEEITQDIRERRCLNIKNGVLDKLSELKKKKKYQHLNGITCKRASVCFRNKRSLVILKMLLTTNSATILDCRSALDSTGALENKN